MSHQESIWLRFIEIRCEYWQQIQTYYQSPSTDLLKLLDVLFSEVYSAEEKKQILVSEFDIKMTKTLEGEVEQVCDYSNGIWDKGHAQGRVLGREEGREEEREKMLRLIDLMVENGEADRIPVAILL